MYINKVMVYGNLTRDPELKQLPNSGSSVANLSVATNHVWKDQQGAKREDVEYHNVVVFGKMAELVTQYLNKGSGVFVEGRLRTNSWEQDGVKKYRTEIVADRVQFGPKRNSGSVDGGHTPATDDSVGSTGINPDDIPF